LKLNRQQFETMALAQLDTLYRVARRLTRDNSTAEDLVQETYVRALRGWETFQLGEFGIRPWLVRILQNLHFSRSQREQKQPHGVEQAHLEAMSGGTEPKAAPLTTGTWDGMDQQLVRALNQLPAEYRVVLQLWAVEEFSYKEIAEAIDIPIGTVMSRLHRARQRLSEQLREYALKEGVIRE
jgi:RNA polymerase sigma-70 factor, ECF subfamily